MILIQNSKIHEVRRYLYTEHWYSTIFIHELWGLMFEANKAEVLCPLQKIMDLYLKTGDDQYHGKCIFSLLPP
jgi:hypothetical protein